MEDNLDPEDREQLVEHNPEFWEEMEGQREESAAREQVEEELLGEVAQPRAKRSFLEFNVSKNKGIVAGLALLTTQVTRLTVAVERILEEAYGVRSQQGDIGGAEPEVDYTNQDRFDIQEALEQAKDLEEPEDR
jgi:hypothetical protein